ncbi:MAG: hypothetical protein O7G85_03295 [Planctomycetota bacterium]|nr:hypothetical protein [Planctomycetota bacterium]
MKEYRLRDNLTRAVINGYAMPLGLEPGDLSTPITGYTIAFSQGEEDEPDSYSFHVVVSHEKIKPILARAIDLLPEAVSCILEVESSDAYRTLDVYLSADPIDKSRFLESWEWFEPFLLEDCFIGAGANSEEPFIEVFLDQWKRLSIHVPLDMRDEVEDLFKTFDLEEIPQLWPVGEDDDSFGTAMFRSVLELSDEFSPDLDEMIHELKHAWQLELNIDPDRNRDESGRELGPTLWHAVAIVNHTDEVPEHGAYASIWITASSLSEVNDLIFDALEVHDEWRYVEMYTVDRVAFDDRPEDLADLKPRRDETELHSLSFEIWAAPPEELLGE